MEYRTRVAGWTRSTVMNTSAHWYRRYVMFRDASSSYRHGPGVMSKVTESRVISTVPSSVTEGEVSWTRWEKRNVPSSLSGTADPAGGALRADWPPQAAI